MDWEKELLELISQRTGLAIEKILDRSEFEQDLNLSHNELIDFITEVEKKFNLPLSDEVIAEIKTVADLKEALFEHLEISN